MAKSKLVATFNGKGIIATPYTLRDPFTKWRNLKIELYEDYLEFIFENKKIEVTFDQIDDIGFDLPRKALEIAKNNLDDISIYGSFRLNPPDEDKFSIGYAPEASIYGEPTINAFLKKLFQQLLNKKEIKLQYARIVGGSVDVSSEWEDGYLVFAKKPVKRGVSVIEEMVLAVAVTSGDKPKVYDLFTNIESISLEKKKIDEEDKEVLEIKQLRGGETVNSYIHIPSTKLLYVLRYISKLTKYHNTVKSLLPKSEDDLDSEIAVESWSGDKLKNEVDQLTSEEQEVLAAIYTGITSLELPGMMGMPIDEVEKILEKLIDGGFLDLVRIRKETDLTEKGRAVTNFIITNF
uniref:Chemotaxis signal transduction system protein F from archaea n=1 Tax=Methanococcus maripaludis (strain C6 / ATCC BAA-1332) TaxID=444158 RepID=A9AB10_METM6